MPRYYFDCFDGREFHIDKFGMDLQNASEAVEHGSCLAVEMLGEAPPSIGTCSVSVMVRSSEGEHLYTAHCSFNGFKHQEQAVV